MSGHIYYGQPLNPNFAPNRGVVGCWQVLPWYKSGPRFIDISGFRNHGTLTNGPTWSPLTHPGGFGSLAFTAASLNYVTIPDTPALDITTALTMLAWVYSTADGAWQTIVSRRPGDSGAAVQWGMSKSNTNKLTMQGGNPGWWGVQGSASIPTGTWTHVAVTFVNATVAVRLFINGILDSTGTGAGAISSHASAVTIGRNEDPTYPEYWGGNLNDVRIIPRTLSDGEIWQAFNDSYTGSQRTLRRIPRVTYFAQAAAPGGTNPKGVFGLPIDGPMRRVVY